MIGIFLALDSSDRNFAFLIIILITIVTYIVWQHRLVGKTKDLFRPADQAFMWETKMRLFEGSVQAIIAIDENNNVVAWNNRAEEFFGWSEKEMLGKNMADHIIPLKYREMHKKGIESYVKNRKPSRLIDNKDGLELEALRKDGSIFPIRLYLAEFETKEGFLSFGAWIADISGEIKRRQGLQKIISHHELGEEMGRTAAWWYNILDNTIGGTKGFYKLYGFKEGEPLTFENVLAHIYYKDKKLVADSAVEAIETNRITENTVQYRIFRPDGSLFLVEATSRPTLDDSGKIIEFVGIVKYLNEVKDAT